MAEHARKIANLSQAGETMRVKAIRRNDTLFSGRSFRFIREFHLPREQRAVTMTGQQVRHGFIIRDAGTGEHHIVGLTLLRHIADRYHAIELPPEIRFRRQETSIVHGEDRWRTRMRAAKRAAKAAEDAAGQ